MRKVAQRRRQIALVTARPSAAVDEDDERRGRAAFRLPEVEDISLMRAVADIREGGRRRGGGSGP